MRTTLATVTRLLGPFVAVGLVACGGSTATPSTTPASSGPSEPSPAPAADGLGTSGLAGLDWGASVDAVRALYPMATAADDGVVAIGMTEGHQSLTHFTIGAAGLREVSIEWIEGFISMQDCAEGDGGWTTLRAVFDKRFGASQADNLAAYWDLPTVSIVLACNPNDFNAGVLSMNYAPPQAEESAAR